ncbi:TadG family pilus assembly protein [Aporhodopirellula aestuarii]|uniref:Pilus assembly protein TadG-related protein n=1 Tax=Aporhodopirellula aestuarii TaxID=2950107 RepID=A0ABT0UDT2_9BACT|nr:TadG family pilus assembly protein [Aporhodopirellula aestuarii]MCM2374986.1 pilus assembly protein TadG-related protein [Aporhodopirellula aestuarii]
MSRLSAILKNPNLIFRVSTETRPQPAHIPCVIAKSRRDTSPPRRCKRSGSASVLGIMLISVMAVILGMTIDLGYIHVSQSELRRTSDSAALAACWELFDAKVDGLSDQEAAQQVAVSADLFGSQNKVAQSYPHVYDQGDDITLGYYDVVTRQFDTNSPADINAVRVNVHRQGHTNGEVPLFFGTVLGRQTQPMTSTSIAALLNTVNGFYVPATDSQTLDILPFALDEDTWQSVVDGETDDSLSWSNGQVVATGNGKCECNLYPQGTGSPGNRGTVDIGSSNNSTNDIARQILSGISRDDLLDLNGPLEFNVNGELFLNGDTGISAGVKDELESIIGETRIIPVFREVNGNGNNAVYTIVKFVGVRILAVKLTGRMSGKCLTVEPAPMVARNAIVSVDGNSYSDYLYTPVMLVD